MLGGQILHSKIKSYARRFGNNMAIIEADTGSSLTYRQLFTAVNALENYLGDKKKVLVILPGGVIDACLWMTCLIFGHLLIPVSPQLTEFELEQIISLHKPQVIINSESISELEEIIKKTLEKDFVTYSSPQDGQVLIRTSGSTGTPKEMVLSATQIVITGQNIKKSHRITRRDRGLTPLAFYHVNAPVVSLTTSLLAGSTVIIAPKYSTSQFWEWVRMYDPTWISLIPTMIAMLLNTNRPAFLEQASLRFIRTASEALPVENLKRFEEKFKIPVVETYGLSEAASTVFANPVPPRKHKPGSVGKPLGVQVKICPLGQDIALPQGQTGEVCLKGDNIIKRYEHDRSLKSFINGWFRTGDLGFLDRAGDLHLTGRIKDIIIRGGENIAPREIEEVLLSYPGVREAIVVGQPDPIYGECVVAFVVMQDFHEKDILQQLKAYITSKLIPQKVPERIILLRDLPRNKTGKVDKRLLQDPQQAASCRLI